MTIFALVFCFLLQTGLRVYLFPPLCHVVQVAAVLRNLTSSDLKLLWAGDPFARYKPTVKMKALNNEWKVWR